MTYIAAGALAVIVLLVVAIYRLQVAHLQSMHLAEKNTAAEREMVRQRNQLERSQLLDERRELLNRIQHPQFVPTPQIAYEPPPPPKDLAELGFVGEEVPDFYKVGGMNDGDA